MPQPPRSAAAFISPCKVTIRHSRPASAVSARPAEAFHATIATPAARTEPARRPNPPASRVTPIRPCPDKVDSPPSASSTGAEIIRNPPSAKAVSPIARESAGWASVHSVRRRTNAVTSATKPLSAGATVLPNPMNSPSSALFSSVTRPAKLSPMMSATVCAVPPTAESCSMNEASDPSPACLISSAAPAPASSPKMSFRYVIRRAEPMPSIAADRSVRIATMSRTLPSPSTVSTPSAASEAVASPTGDDRRENTARNVVPAWDALMPTLPSSPAMAAALRNDTPAVAATGPTYFMVSPSMPSVVLDDVNVAVSRSATPVMSAASRPKPDRMSDAMSEAWPRSTAPARAIASTPGMEAMMSFALNPAIPKYRMPSAAWVAENDVVAPRSRAVAVIAAICASVAPATAATEDMACSKWADALSGPAIAAVTPAPTAPTITPAAATPRPQVFSPWATRAMRFRSPIERIMRRTGAVS